MEANIKTIIVNNGIGREVNPNHYFKGQDDDEVDENMHEAVSNLRWNKFEQSVQSYPCPELPNTKPGETVKAELVWQMRANRDLVESGIDKEIKWIDVNINLIDGLRPEALRQIWRLVKEEKDMKKEISISEQIALKEMRKHALMSLPTDSEVAEWHDLNIDPNDATVSSAIYKFRLWLKDRLTPPTLK